MTLKNINNLNFGLSVLTIGEPAFLNSSTPCRLFEACNGNKYVIPGEQGFKYAVALQHRRLPKFTRQDLLEPALEYGKWWGPYELLISASQVGKVSNKSRRSSWPTAAIGETPGLLGIGDGVAMLMCHVGLHEALWLALGYVNAMEFADYSSWAIVAMSDGETFFEHMQTKTIIAEKLKVSNDRPMASGVRKPKKCQR